MRLTRGITAVPLACR